MGWFRNMIQKWLELKPANQQSITIREALPFEGTVARNKIWYRGDAAELDQFFKGVNDCDVGASRFWAASPITSKIRKIHSGLPAIMIDTLAYLVKSDLSDVTFEEDQAKEKWEEILGELDFSKLIGSALVSALVAGDGAFKISVDTDVSGYPLVEFFEGDRVEFRRTRGKITEIVFLTDYVKGKETYQLREIYGVGYITYELWKSDKQVPIETIPELAPLQPVEFSKYNMAVPLIIFDNPKFPGRGKSILENKTEVLDALDEVISQWMDALRAGRVQKYIPEDLIPRDEKDGGLRSLNSFGSEFIKLGSPIAEDKQSKIETIQPEIRYEAFLNTYVTTLDLCLQGIVSPATLGIDVGKMSSAEAQREKKDVTGNTRNSITAVLEKVIPELAVAILKTYDHMMKEEPEDYNASVEFGEYGAPDFDSRIQTVSTAAASGIMSIEAMVEQLWSSTKDDEWKAEEVQRIKEQKGIAEMAEPSVGGVEYDI